MARATRRLVQQRDGYRCVVCGATERLEVHHIVPRRLGGSNDPVNLVTLCAACHRRHDRAAAPSLSTTSHPLRQESPGA